MRPTDPPAATAHRAETADAAAVARFLRALAERAERDSAFGRDVGEALAQSGLLGADTSAIGGAAARRARARPASAPSDIFQLLRQGGPDAVRARLEEMDAAALHELIRVHRLDPARISARWARRDRLARLIVEQVRGRADHGKAFANV